MAKRESIDTPCVANTEIFQRPVTRPSALPRTPAGPPQASQRQPSASSIGGVAQASSASKSTELIRQSYGKLFTAVVAILASFVLIEICVLVRPVLRVAVGLSLLTAVLLSWQYVRSVQRLAQLARHDE